MQFHDFFRSPILGLVAKALALSGTALPAQSTLAGLGGVVRMPDGEVVDGAVITAVSTRFHSTTDADGAFSLIGLPAGSPTLEIERRPE